MVLLLFVALRDFGRSGAKRFVSNRKKIFGVFLTSQRTFFNRTVFYHARDKQIGLRLRGRPMLLSLV